MSDGITQNIFTVNEYQESSSCYLSHLSVAIQCVSTNGVGQQSEVWWLMLGNPASPTRKREYWRVPVTLQSITADWT